MIVSGVAQPSAEMVALRVLAQTLNLEVGQILNARVSQLLGDGRGVLQLADGGEVTFSRGFGLIEGEGVRLQVMRTLPEVALRVVASETGEASRLAESVERTLLKAPDLFSRLLRFAGVSDWRPATTSTAASLPADLPDMPPTETVATPRPGPTVQTAPGQTVTVARPGLWPAAAEQLPASTPMQSLGPVLRLPMGLLLTAQGEPFPEVLRQNLPNLAMDPLVKGDVKELVKIMTGQNGGGHQAVEAVRRLRVAAESLTLAKNPNLEETEIATTREVLQEAGGETALLREAKQSLQRLADLITTQDLLPKSQTPADPTALLGYRVFWLPEGGMGEVMWRRESAGKGKTGDKEGFSVLLSLQLSRLGLVQAHLSLGEGFLNIQIAAREEGSLAALRQQIGDLRQGLLEAELPLRTLHLNRLSEGEMAEERRQGLGLAGGLRMEA